MSRKIAEKILIVFILLATSAGVFFARFWHPNFFGDTFKAVKSFNSDHLFYKNLKENMIENIAESQENISETPPDQMEKRDIENLDVKDPELNVAVSPESEENQNQEPELTDVETGDAGENKSAETEDETKLLPAKKNLTDSLRIGLITDIHAGSTIAGAARVLKEEYLSEIGYFIRQMNNEFGPDLIMAGGDLIEGTKVPAAQGMHELGLIKSAFQKTTIPAYWTLGNHDLRSISKSQWKQIFGYTNTSVVFGDYKIIILDSNYDSDDNSIKPGKYYTRGNVAQDQVRWLKAQLHDSDKKSIVFVHHPPLRGIDSREDSGLLKNAEELHGLFEKYEVLAVFSGHIEDLYYEKKDGVRYYVIPGTTKHPKYNGSFAEIRVNGSKVDVSLSYISGNGYKKINVD